ncbi:MULTISPECIES: hypothetical protein [Buttiauxella]|uniref:hypothetical protein n=1 Tax=Buttiauxella TaxID=82976 RepID=UPI0015606440|nr:MULTISPECIES: hypothetical protein [Buttiauxella]MCS3601654.1 hypothetical protein [Buttiauxella sp. BIGb0471]BCG09241.1 hypothetical protein BADSM9389_19070 [Buttiauxella agrestis]
MNRSKREKLIDQLIGEAVLSILYDNGAISTRSLVERLQIMEATERDDHRRDVIADVIADISNHRLGLSRRALIPAQNDGDRDGQIEQSNNVYSLFDESPVPGSSKKH